MAEKKPWGSYSILFQAPDYQVKRVEVLRGHRLSLQKHAKRAEKWIIVSGIGEATLGTERIPIERGSVVDIAVEEVHRIQNTGEEALVFIEVQFGAYLGEDDIVRIQDDYSRK
jgi:mannose-6-phosphate isomerase-like protein (cupin superfamily)